MLFKAYIYGVLYIILQSYKLPTLEIKVGHQGSIVDLGPLFLPKILEHIGHGAGKV